MQPSNEKKCGQYTLKEYEHNYSCDTSPEQLKLNRLRHPGTIPVIVKRHKTEKYLPDLGQKLYLAPEHLQMAAFLMIVRNRLELPNTRAIFLFVNGQVIVSPSHDMRHLFANYGADDGLLHITYASEECFGQETTPDTP